MSRAHALLSPSAAHRWMNCTAAPLLEQGFPDTTSEVAAEGTLAHEIGERKLRGLPWDDLKTKDRYSPEMDAYTDEYVEAIDTARMAFSTEPYMAVECRFSLQPWIPDGFGTADCVLIGDDMIHVIDFKYGKGVPVYAEHNPQLMLYALGAVAKYSIVCGFHTIKIQIIQPRINNVDAWECSIDELTRFGKEVSRKARIAYDGSGVTMPGDWCQFCRARQQCRARADENVRLAFAAEKKPPLITNEEVGEYLEKGRFVSKWLSDLEDYALKECLAGREIPGWKAVEGRSNRKFDNLDQAFHDLQSRGISEAVLYERKPLSLSAIETMLGKKRFTEYVGSHIVKPPGKPTLVPATDKREPIRNQPSAADAFGGTHNG